MTTMLGAIKNDKCPDCSSKYKIKHWNNSYPDEINCESCGGSFFYGDYLKKGKIVKMVVRRKLHDTFDSWIKRNISHHSTTPAIYVRKCDWKEIVKNWYRIKITPDHSSQGWMWGQIYKRYQWCHENCQEKWTSRDWVIFFESPGDAINFKLTWL